MDTDSALDKLETQFDTEKHFSRLVDQFLDITETTDLISQSAPAKAADVKKIIKKAVLTKMKTNESIKWLPEPLHYKRRHFYHGSGMISGRLFQFFYFFKSHKGLLVLSDFSGRCDFIKMSGQTTKGPADLSDN